MHFLGSGGATSCPVYLLNFAELWGAPARFAAPRLVQNLNPQAADANSRSSVSSSSGSGLAHLPCQEIACTLVRAALPAALSCRNDQKNTDATQRLTEPQASLERAVLAVVRACKSILATQLALPLALANCGAGVPTPPFDDITSTEADPATDCAARLNVLLRDLSTCPLDTRSVHACLSYAATAGPSGSPDAGGSASAASPYTCPATVLPAGTWSFSSDLATWPGAVRSPKGPGALQGPQRRPSPGAAVPASGAQHGAPAACASGTEGGNQGAAAPAAGAASGSGPGAATAAGVAAQSSGAPASAELAPAAGAGAVTWYATCSCPRVWEPVCDTASGRQYPNSCYAECQGASHRSVPCGDLALPQPPASPACGDADSAAGGAATDSKPAPRQSAAQGAAAAPPPPPPPPEAAASRTAPGGTLSPESHHAPGAPAGDGDGRLDVGTTTAVPQVAGAPQRRPSGGSDDDLPLPEAKRSTPTRTWSSLFSASAPLLATERGAATGRQDGRLARLQAGSAPGTAPHEEGAHEEEEEGAAAARGRGQGGDLRRLFLASVADTRATGGAQPGAGAGGGGGAGSGSNAPGQQPPAASRLPPLTFLLTQLLQPAVLLLGDDAESAAAAAIAAAAAGEGGAGGGGAGTSTASEGAVPDAGPHAGAGAPKTNLAMAVFRAHSHMPAGPAGGAAAPHPESGGGGDGLRPGAERGGGGHGRSAVVVGGGGGSGCSAGGDSSADCTAEQHGGDRVGDGVEDEQSYVGRLLYLMSLLNAAADSG